MLSMCMGAPLAHKGKRNDIEPKCTLFNSIPKIILRNCAILYSKEVKHSSLVAEVIFGWHKRFASEESGRIRKE